jgi:hypothetical protein
MKKLITFDREFYRNWYIHFYCTLFFVLLLSVVFVSCGTTKPSATQKQKVEMIADKDST